MLKLLNHVIQFFRIQQKKTEPKNAALGTRIKDVRTNLNYTQNQFAKKLSVNRRTVSRWENGFHTPKSDQLHRIAKLAGKGIIWLMYNEDYSTPNS